MFASCSNRTPGSNRTPIVSRRQAKRDSDIFFQIFTVTEAALHEVDAHTGLSGQMPHFPFMDPPEESLNPVEERDAAAAEADAATEAALAAMGGSAEERAGYHRREKEKEAVKGSLHGERHGRRR